MIPIIFFLWVSSSATNTSIQVDLNKSHQIDQAAQHVLQTIEETKPKIVLLAEDHSQWDVKSFYKSVIQEVVRKSRKRICYFLETKETYQQALDNLEIANLESVECFESAHRTIQKDFLEVFGRMPNHWLNTVQLADLNRQGVKILAIDKNLNKDDYEDLKKIKENSSGSNQQIGLSLNQVMNGNSSVDMKGTIAALQQEDDFVIRMRNKHMSAKIQELFSKHDCELGFASLGTYHVFPPPRMMDPQIPGFSTFLPNHLPSIGINGRACMTQFECRVDERAVLNIFFPK